MGIDVLVVRIIDAIALVVEVGAALLIAAGAAQALVRMFRAAFREKGSSAEQRGVWLQFASWLVLALEFTLAADVARTAIAPTWTRIGQLAAIAGIRTGLNYFLTRDIRELTETSGGGG